MFKATIDKFQTLKGKDEVSILMTAKKSDIAFIGALEGKEVIVGGNDIVVHDSKQLKAALEMIHNISSDALVEIYPETHTVMDEVKPKESVPEIFPGTIDELKSIRIKKEVA